MRTSPYTLTLALSVIGLIGCRGYETGIDRTVIQGTLSIPPQLVNEDESAQGLNDDVEVPSDLGYLVGRVIQVSGTCLDFSRSTFDGSPTGDLDWYTFVSQGDATITLAFDYPGPGSDVDPESPPDETIAYDVSVYDLDAGVVIAGGGTVGTYGAYETSFDVLSGVRYGVRVGGTKNLDSAAEYTLELSGLDPNEGSFLVGAYLEADPALRDDPVGGTSVSELAYDDASMTWAGPFEILFIRSVEPATSEYGVLPEDVDEALSVAYLMGGDISTLNGGILAGTMFSSVMPEVSLSTDDAETDLVTDVAVVVDTVQPIQYGWTFSEVEPNDVGIGSNDTNYLLDGDTSVANVTNVASGLGYLDTIAGSLTYAVDDPGWGSDIDVFALTVSEELSGSIKLDWSDPTYDLDLVIYGADGVSIAFSAYSDYPEIATLSDWGVTLSPGETYYIQVLGYGGAAGEMPYSVSLEWFAP